MAKGSQFEREVCVRLSEWWTGGTRQDVFWRSSTSGGRATTRAKSGKTTAGSYGDISSIDPIGQPLLDMFTFEIKRGYSRHTVHDLLDNPNKSTWHEFIDQAVTAHEQAGSVAWAIISKRDRKDATIWTTTQIADILRIWAPMGKWGRSIEIRPLGVTGVPLIEWLKTVSPQNIKDLLRKM